MTMKAWKDLLGPFSQGLLTAFSVYPYRQLFVLSTPKFLKGSVKEPHWTSWPPSVITHVIHLLLHILQHIYIFHRCRHFKYYPCTLEPKWLRIAMYVSLHKNIYT